MVYRRIMVNTAPRESSVVNEVSLLLQLCAIFWQKQIF